MVWALGEGLGLGPRLAQDHERAALARCRNPPADTDTWLAAGSAAAEQA